MRIKDIINRLDGERGGEILRFVIVGVLATALQYAVYWLLLFWLSPSLSLTIGYAVSFVFNFMASTRYTFRVKANVQRGAGFALAHAVNYLLQLSTLSFFIWLGVSKELAPIPMFCVCVPVNFLLVRFFLKREMLMKKIFRLFRVRCEELWPSLVAVLVFVVLNGLAIRKYYDKFSDIHQGVWTVFAKYFQLSGFDPISYSILTQWDTKYNVYRHPLLAFMMYPFSMLNQWLRATLHLNCVQFIMAALLLLSVFYTFVFLYRTLREVVGVGRTDATLLSAMLFSFAYIMVAFIVPDHFAFSTFLLVFTIYLSGHKMRQGRAFSTLESVVLFVLTAGVTLSNGIKVFICELFTNGRRFFRPRYLAFAVLVPSALIWLFARWEYRTFVWPKETARKELKKKQDAERKQRDFKLFADTTRLKDSAAIKKAFKAQQNAKMWARYRANRKKPWNQHTGKPMGKGEFMRWTDKTTSRWDTAVENLFGESIQLHRGHLLEDTLRSRPVIVRYDWPICYVVEGAIVLLFLGGIFAGRRHRFVWMVLGCFAFDLALHLGLGFGINEVYIMAPHWLFVLPIVTGYLVRGLRGRWLLGVRALLLLLTCWLCLYNGSLLIGYLNQ